MHMKQHSAEQDLLMIRKIMQDSHQRILADGAPLIAWGLAFAVATAYTYVQALAGQSVGPWIWYGAMAVGAIFTIIDVRKNRHQPETFANKMIGTIWGTCGSAIGVTATALALSNTLSGQGLMAVICVILGIAYLLTGVVYGIAWFRNLVFGWWAGGIAIAYINSYHVLGVYLLMLIAFEIVPGFILSRRAKQPEHVQLASS